MFIAGVRHFSIAVLMVSCLLSINGKFAGGRIAFVTAHIARGLTLLGLLLSKVSY